MRELDRVRAARLPAAAPLRPPSARRRLPKIIFSVEGLERAQRLHRGAPLAPSGAPTWAGSTPADLVAEQQTRFEVVQGYSPNLTVSTASIAYGDTTWLGAFYATGGYQGYFDS